VPDARAARRPPTLRNHLLWFVAGATLPPMLLALAFAVLLVQDERTAFRRAATERSRALMTAVDAELRGSVTTLRALATSDALKHRDLAAFRAEAARVLASQGNWLNLTLAEPSGQQIVNARRPFGTPLPGVADMAMLHRVLDTRQAVIGGIAEGPLLHQPGVLVRVPVIEEGALVYILTALVDPASFDPLLASQKLSRNWALGVVDQQKRFVSRIPRQAPGAPASEAFSAALDTGPEGWFSGTTLEGRPSYSSFSRSSFSGWGVGIAIPASEVEAPAWRVAAGTAGGIALSVMLTGLSVVLLGRRISKPITSLRMAARGMGGGTEVELQQAQSIAETADVAAALAQAADRIRQRETQQRHAEAALAKERAQLLAVIQSMSDGVVVFDMAGRLVLANEAQAKLLGYAGVDQLHKELAEYAAAFQVTDLTGRALPLEQWPVSRVLRGESFRDSELAVVRTDTGQRWIIAFSAQPVRAGGGEQILSLVVSRDITEKKEREDRLRLSIERYRLASAAAGIGYWNRDLRTGAIEWSDEQRRLYGFPADAAPSQELWNAATLPADAERVQSAIRTALERRSVYRAEFRIHHPVHGERTLLGMGRVIEGADGEPERFVGVDLDVTELKRAEEAFRSLNATLERRVAERTAELAQANLEMETFTYTVSHDLRAPLRGMQGFAQILQEDFGPALGSTGSAHCQRIVTAAERMEELIEDLLSYCRLGQQEVQIGLVDLDRAVAEALEMVEAERAAGRAEVTVEQPLGMASGHHMLVVQIVQNMLGNAVKFVAPGVTPQVMVKAERAAGRVRVWVQDNGIGIEPAYLVRIFEPFRRLHTQQTYRGTGIGLAIVKRGVERLGGRCGVMSSPGAGSRFWIELPTPAETT